MNEWVWSNGGMILTGENWSTGRKTLYSVGGRWMNEYGAMLEWYWQGKTEVMGENLAALSICSPQIPHERMQHWVWTQGFRVLEVDWSSTRLSVSDSNMATVDWLVIESNVVSVNQPVVWERMNVLQRSCLPAWVPDVLTVLRRGVCTMRHPRSTRIIKGNGNYATHFLQFTIVSPLQVGSFIYKY